jgi:multidrug resistance efflux pump
MPVASPPELESMQVEADLSDVDDGKVRPGMRVDCYLDAFPGLRYSGRIVEISPVARESRRSPLLRSFPVLIALDHPDPGRMRPGMSVRVEVAGAERPASLLVPRASLDLNGARPRAGLRDGGFAEVTLGPCSASQCVVESGLAEGALLRSLAPGMG